MKSGIIYLYLFNTLSDWEIGYVTAGINNPIMQINPGKYHLKTFSSDGNPIYTIGGLKITPDLSLNEVSVSDAEMLILPGGKSWDEGSNHEVTLLAKKLYENQVRIAAICGATIGLAKIGLLDTIKHTSNSKKYILNSGYKGSKYYIEDLSVCDNNIITATGTDPLEFSKNIFKELNLYKSEVLESWYKLFKSSSPEAFVELMNALGA